MSVEVGGQISCGTQNLVAVGSLTPRPARSRPALSESQYHFGWQQGRPRLGMGDWCA